MLTTFIDAGLLKHRLVLEQVIETSDGSGGAIITWSEVATLWASIDSVHAAMRHLAQQSKEAITHRITMRFRGDISSGWRFRKGNRIFKIITVRDLDETVRYLVCRTEEQGR